MKDKYIYLLRYSSSGYQPYITSLHKLEISDVIGKLAMIRDNLVQAGSNQGVVSMSGIDEAMLLLARIME